MLKSCMGESALQFSDDQLNELTRTLLEEADADNSGSLTFDELQSALNRHPGLVENLTFRLVANVVLVLLNAWFNSDHVTLSLHVLHYYPQCCKLVSAPH